jgi:hypothetical protein
MLADVLPDSRRQLCARTLGVNFVPGQRQNAGFPVQQLCAFQLIQCREQFALGKITQSAEHYQVAAGVNLLDHISFSQFVRRPRETADCTIL